MNGAPGGRVAPRPDRHRGPTSMSILTPTHPVMTFRVPRFMRRPFRVTTVLKLFLLVLPACGAGLDPTNPMVGRNEGLEPTGGGTPPPAVPADGGTADAGASAPAAANPSGIFPPDN